MSSIVKHTDKRSGITYAYESISYWDKETKMPRCKRKLIGRVDPETGEIVPTDGRCRKRSPYYDSTAEGSSNKSPRTIAEYKAEVARLREENTALRAEIERLKGHGDQ